MSRAGDSSQGHISPAGPHLRQRGDEFAFMYMNKHADKHTQRTDGELVRHAAPGRF